MDYEQIKKAVDQSVSRKLLDPEFIKLFRAMLEPQKKVKKKKDDKTQELFQ